MSRFITGVAVRKLRHSRQDRPPTDGVIAVPSAVAIAVLARALARSRKEEQFRTQIEAGARLAELVGVDAQLDRLEINRIKGRWEPR